MRSLQVLISMSLMILFFHVSCKTDVQEAGSFKVIFDHYSGDQDFLAVSLPPSLISLVMKAEKEDELLSLFRNLSSFSILSIENNQDKLQVLQEFKKTLESYTHRNGFVDMFFINSSSDEFYIRIKNKDEIIQEALIVINNSGSFTAIDLRGQIDPRMLTGLAEQGELLHIPGLDLQVN